MNLSFLDGVSLPQLVDVSGCPECPLLKYVLTPQEQQRKAMYYQQHPAAIVAPPPIIYKPKQMVRTFPPKQPAFSMVPQQPSAVSVPPPFVQSSVPVQVPQQVYYRAPVQVCVNQSQSIGNYPNPIYPPSQPGLSSHTVHYTYQVPSNTGSVWSPYRS